MQGATLQGLADFLGGVALQRVECFRIVQYVEIPHQKQSANAGSLHSVNQRVRRQHLLDRSRYDGRFHVLAVEWQPWCV
ncbi:hypothetical protein D3C71_2106110 [compost metagenome]